MNPLNQGQRQPTNRQHAIHPPLKAESIVPHGLWLVSAPWQPGSGVVGRGVNPTKTETSRILPHNVSIPYLGLLLFKTIAENGDKVRFGDQGISFLNQQL